MTDQGPPTIAYWHLFVGDDGVSRQRRCAFTAFELKGIQPSAAPQWIGRTTHGDMGVLTSVLPVGWVGQWHENPKPQWIVPLSGRWFVEAMDGQRVEMGPGEISFGADQGCSTVEGRTGHLSGTVGDAPAVLMMIQMDEGPSGGPCPFG